MEYKKFIEDYEFIILKGLKGLDEVQQIHDRHSGQIYDFIQIDHRGNQIDPMQIYLKKVMNFSSSSILKMHNYSFVFQQEHHGDPYCRFFLILEYCESTLGNELQNLKRKNRQFKHDQMKKIILSLVQGIKYIEDEGLSYNDLAIENILLNEKKEYKIIPPKLKNVNTKYKSPEQFQNKNFRFASERIKIDQYKSQAFQLGYMILEVGLNKELELYGKFKLNEQVLDKYLEQFKAQYGIMIYEVLQSMMKPDPKIRLSCKEILEKYEFLKQDKNEKITNHLNQIHSPNFQIDEIEQNEKQEENQDLLDVPYSPKQSQSSKNMIEMTPSQEEDNQKSNSKSKLIMDRFYKGVQAYKNTVMFVKTLKDDDHENLEHWIYQVLPQDYQDEIDNEINGRIKEIENSYELEYYKNGCKFQGEKNASGQPHGYGIFWYANGDTYEGQFKEGKFSGIGIYYFSQGAKHYGQFVNGIIQGLGVRTYQDGSIYFGEWQKGLNHGKGTFYWTNKAKFKGNFHHDKIYGRGILIYYDIETKQERKYEGLWKDEEDKGISVYELK